MLSNVNEALLVHKGSWESSNTDLAQDRCEYNGKKIPYSTAAFMIQVGGNMMSSDSNAALN